MSQITIETRSAMHIFAPASIWLEVTNVDGLQIMENGPSDYDPYFHDITYIWEVRGRPLPKFSAPMNMVSTWNEPNVMYGKSVAFFFPEPGEYIVDLTATDRNGNTAFAEKRIIVGDEVAAGNRYPGKNTICFSKSSDFSGAPIGARKITVSDSSDINDVWRKLSDPTRILFKRNELYEDVRLRISPDIEFVGAYGKGQKPLLKQQIELGSMLNTGTGGQHTITDIEFVGDWNPITETGSADQGGPGLLTGSPINFLRSDTRTHYHISRCCFRGFTAVNLTPGFHVGASESMMIVADSVFTDWRDYGVFVNVRPNKKYFALIGSRLQQNVRAKNGGPKDSSSNTHGPIRIERMEHVFLSQLDLFSRSGWSRLPPDRADQPCIRLNSSPLDNDNSAIIDRVVCEGGFRIISIEGQNRKEQEFPGNYLLDKVLLIGTAKTSSTFLRIAYGGITLRNIIGIMPNVPDYHKEYWTAPIQINVNNPTEKNLSSPVTIHNCTFLNLREGSNNLGTKWKHLDGNFFENLIYENNILYEVDPTRTSTSQIHLDLQSKMSGIIPRYSGVYFGDDLEIDGSYASPRSIPVPKVVDDNFEKSSPSEGRNAHIDFFGNIRGSTTSLGAID